MTQSAQSLGGREHQELRRVDRPVAVNGGLQLRVEHLVRHSHDALLDERIHVVEERVLAEFDRVEVVDRATDVTVRVLETVGDWLPNAFWAIISHPSSGLDQAYFQSPSSFHCSRSRYGSSRRPNTRRAPFCTENPFRRSRSARWAAGNLPRRATSSATWGRRAQPRQPARLSATGRPCSRRRSWHHVIHPGGVTATDEQALTGRIRLTPRALTEHAARQWRTERHDSAASDISEDEQTRPASVRSPVRRFRW